ncbi:cytochrome P450 [Gordonia sp. DT218]|uniref:cytochrome P450 n=1 Tax=Gordonia sp. DT218 TaxID=3416659 RepID=UPI003CF2D519
MSLRPVCGRRGIPLSSTIRLRRDPTGLAESLRAEFGDIALTSALGHDVVVAQGPEAAWQLVRDPDRAFANAPVYGFALGGLFERGILLMDHAEHHAHRRIMQEAFTRENLSKYQRTMQPIIVSAVDRLPVDDDVDMRVWLKALALDISLQIFVGTALTQDQADRINRSFVELIEAASALVRLPVPGLRWRRGHTAKQVVDDFFGDLLPTRRSDPGPDLMSALCSARSPDGQLLTDREVIDHMRFMLFAAHDTATIAMTSMAYQLGRHPEWQQRVRDEAMALPEHPDHSDLADMASMDLVMREALRLRPPVPVIPRAALRDTSLCGYHIPEGTFVISLIGANHRRSDVWSEPDQFDPERFCPDRAEDRSHRMAWMPFGGGAHKCIGMHFARVEAFTVLHDMVRRFSWTVGDDDMEGRDAGLTDNAGFVATVTRLDRRMT